MNSKQLKQIIREEIQNVLKEAKTWNKNEILKFFKYLSDRHGMTAKPKFKTDTSGSVDILMGGPGFDANFVVDGNNLILKQQSLTDMTAKDFLADIESDGPVGYKFQVKGKLVLVTI
jgi:hypothetical protein